LDKPKEYLIINSDKIVSPKLEKKFHIFLTRRLSGWPVPYLTNNKEFNKLDFYVDTNVLIPRPETEGLVDLVLSKIKGQKSLSILDIGTGSGAIIISLAANYKLPTTNYTFFASDVSPKALEVAKKNANQHKVKITFKQGSLLEPWKDQYFDIIVANLPYLAKQTDSSTKFEPQGALIAEKKGLALFEELFKQLYNLQPTPYNLFLEIGHDQGLAIKKLAAKLLPAFKVQIMKDLSTRDRFAVLQPTPYNL
jgi:release factor glutamine methyltransferase